MTKQLHRRFTDDQIKLVLELYGKRIISLPQALQQLECSRPRFYQLLKRYREKLAEFTIAYGRSCWRYLRVTTDQVPTRWRQVVDKCHMQVIFALFPQTK